MIFSSFASFYNSEDPYKALGPIPKVDPPKIFEISSATLSSLSKLVTTDIRKAFEEDGVVAIRGLLTSSQMEALDAATHHLIEQKLDTTTQQSRRERPSAQFFVQHDNLILRGIH